jgi:uncharacterized protein
MASASLVTTIVVSILLLLSVGLWILRNKIEDWLLFPAGRSPFGQLPNHVLRKHPADYWNRRVRPHVVTAPGPSPNGDGGIRFWYASSPVEDAPVVVYFHGNSGTAADRLPMVSELRRAHKRLRDAAVVLAEYPGYASDPAGLSPSEARILPNALALVDHVNTMLPGRRLCLIGRSLGSCVATYVAAERPETVKALVLVSPFPCIGDVARQLVTCASWLPFDWLLASPFRAKEWAPRVRAPVTILHGTSDALVPLPLGREQGRRFKDLRAFRELPGGHNALEGAASFWPDIAAGLLEN